MTDAIVWLTTCLDHAGEAELAGFLENMNDICIMTCCTEPVCKLLLLSCVNLDLDLQLKRQMLSYDSEATQRRPLCVGGKIADCEPYMTHCVDVRHASCESHI